MRILFFIITLFTGAAVFAQAIKQKTTIAITKTVPYCGGASPSQEILEESRKPKIASGESFYIIRGTRNINNRKIIKTINFNNAGKCTVLLAPGTYAVINAFGYKKLSTDTEQFDMTCLLSLWKKPLFSFTVKAGKSNAFSYTIEQQCPYNIPCSKKEIPVPM